MTVHSDGSSVGLARQAVSADTNFYAVTCEVIIEAIDDDQALNKVLDSALSEAITVRWISTHIIPKGMVING